MTDVQRQRVENELSRKAGERIEINKFNGGFDVLCQTELGAFRVREGYATARMCYSQNLSRWLVTVSTVAVEELTA